jgi:hypothetical protein
MVMVVVADEFFEVSVADSTSVFLDVISLVIEVLQSPVVNFSKTLVFRLL